jgi:signal transduction histidine kinase
VNDGWLELEVTDDGLGVPSEVLEGVGLCSMRERACELGGSFSVERRPVGGTRVCVEIPLCQE